jgi:uncharacterized protein YerC
MLDKRGVAQNQPNAASVFFRNKATINKMVKSTQFCAVVKSQLKAGQQFAHIATKTGIKIPNCPARIS